MEKLLLRAGEQESLHVKVDKGTNKDVCCSILKIHL